MTTMTDFLKFAGTFVAGAVIALVVAPSAGKMFGGQYSTVAQYFTQGIYAGTTNQFSVENDGDVSTTGDAIVDGLTQGGGEVTLTDANGGTYTLTEAELLSGNYLKFAAGGAGQAVVALTLPATSTMTTLIASAGDCREWIYDATALAAATTTTITLGTGHDVIAYTTNDDVIDGNEFAIIKMCRQSDGDVTTFTSELLHAD